MFWYVFINGIVRIVDTLFLLAKNVKENIHFTRLKKSKNLLLNILLSLNKVKKFFAVQKIIEEKSSIKNSLTQNLSSRLIRNNGNSVLFTSLKSRVF